MRRIGACVAVALAALFVAQAAFAAGGTRAEGLGWQYETFTENVTLTYSPVNPNPADTVVVRIESNNPNVPIYSVTTLLQYEIPGMPAATSGLPFFPVNGTVQEAYLSCSAFSNGTVVTFKVMVYDVKYSYIISDNYTFTVTGSNRAGGWKHSLFDDNVDLEWTPESPNATEPVEIKITSKDEVEIYGANLQVVYIIDGQNYTGGYRMTVVNATSMSCILPGYPKGTEVQFWVTAWDKYTNLTISSPRNFTVTEGVDRISHEFVDFESLGAVIGLLSFAAVGAFAFLRVLAVERGRREKGTKYGKTDAGSDGQVDADAEGQKAEAAKSENAAESPKGAAK